MIAWLVVALGLLGSGVLACVAGYKLAYALKKFRYRLSTSLLPADEDDLPSVSVCIAARNETHAMTQCLERVVTSTYPKMEVIVLDDGSTDNTSILIKSFAHAGVRFIEGKPLPEGWIGKNFAQQTLLQEASGSLVLFMDVDTYISPRTIESLVAYAHTHEADMVSVLPLRYDVWRASTLFATMRYFWTLLFHSRQHPAVASGLWMVRRAALAGQAKDFSEYREAVRLEYKIAQQFADEHKYKFLVSTPDLGVTYEKKWSSQVETATRLLFPALGGRVMVMLLALAGCAVAVTPFVMVAVSMAVHDYGWLVVSLIIALGWLAIYAAYLRTVWRGGWYIGMLLLPITLAQECVLLVVSAYKYATGSVTWKGRPLTVRAKKAE